MKLNFYNILASTALLCFAWSALAEQSANKSTSPANKNAENASSNTSAAAGSTVAEGKLRVVGSSFNTRVVLEKPKKISGVFPVSKKSKKALRFCKGKITSQLKALTGMMLQVTGNSTKKCLAPTSFKVLRMFSDRDAMVGIVSKSNEGYTLTTDNNKTYSFPKIPSKLKEALGKKVIIDARPYRGIKTGEKDSSVDVTAEKTSYVVVTYADYPEQ